MLLQACQGFVLSFSNKKPSTSVTEVYLLNIFTDATQRKVWYVIKVYIMIFKENTVIFFPQCGEAQNYNIMKYLYIHISKA